MRKVLFASHSLSTFTQPIIDALKELNLRVAFFDYARPTLLARVAGLSGNIGLLDKNKTEKAIREQINSGLINSIHTFKPDYLFVFKGKKFTAETIRKIKSSGIVTINYFPDYMEDFEWIKINAGTYDYFFNPCEIVIENLKRINARAYYLPFAYNPTYKLKKIPKKYDIVFIGQYTKRRERYFSVLSKLDFHIWGYRKFWQDSKLFNHYRGESTFSQTKKIIGSAKIVVNVLTCEDKIPIKSVNYRVFETTGLGTFLLNWYHEPIDEFFRDGKEIVNFKTKSELLEKATYYLNHDQEREKIARQGWGRTLKDHTWKKRFIKMFKIVF